MFCAVVLSATLALAEDSAEAPSDEQQIRGKWELASKSEGDNQGAELPEGAPLQVSFEDGTWHAQVGPKGAPIEVSGSYTLDAKQTPRLIDVTVQADGNATSIAAIYKIEKDRLHFRVPSGDGQRPADFDVAAPNCITLIFKRAAKD
jgi:uncharacterized protein (TIGR03067 family)